MTNINERLSGLERLTTENNKTLWRIHEAIYGNGKPGLIADVRVLTENVNRHYSDHKEHKIDWQWLATLATAIAAIAATIYK